MMLTGEAEAVASTVTETARLDDLVGLVATIAGRLRQGSEELVLMTNSIVARTTTLLECPWKLVGQAKPEHGGSGA